MVVCRPFRLNIGVALFVWLAPHSHIHSRRYIRSIQHIHHSHHSYTSMIGQCPPPLTHLTHPCHPFHVCNSCHHHSLTHLFGATAFPILRGRRHSIVDLHIGKRWSVGETKERYERYERESRESRETRETRETREMRETRETSVARARMLRVCDKEIESVS